jgi:broad specificity phosphatase PhoE
MQRHTDIALNAKGRQQAINQSHGLDLQAEPMLKERHFGILESHTWLEIQAK